MFSRLRRSPSTTIINNLCESVEAPESTQAKDKAQKRLDAYLSTGNEDTILARGQRLAELTVGLQAPRAQCRAEVADRIAQGLCTASQRFALAWQWGEQSDLQAIVDSTVRATTQMAKELVEDVEVDVEATRKTCADAIANNAYNLRLALGRSQTFSAPVLGALVGEYRPLLADAEARMQDFSRAALTAITTAVGGAEDAAELPEMDKDAALATLERVRQYVCGSIEERFAAVVPAADDSADTTALKAHALLGMLKAMHETYKGTDFSAFQRFYETEAGRIFAQRSPALQTLAQSILAGPIEEAGNTVRLAATRAMQERREQQQAFFQQLQQSLYQNFLDNLPEDPAVRAEAIRTFEETVRIVIGQPFTNPRQPPAGD